MKILYLLAGGGVLAVAASAGLQAAGLCSPGTALSVTNCAVAGFAFGAFALSVRLWGWHENATILKDGDK